MVVALVLISVALSATVTAAFVQHWGWLRRRTKRRVLVHTVDDLSIAGVLMWTGREGVVLTMSTMRGDDSEDVELAGDQWISADRIRFVQVP